MSLAHILAAAHRTKARLHGVAVVYVAGEVEIALATVLKRRKTAVEVTEDGATIETEQDVWQILTSELVSEGEPVVSVPGHTIRETVGGTTYVHEVLPEGAEPGAMHADTQRQILKINTKQIAVEDE